MYVRGKGNEQLQGWLPSYFGGAYPAETWTAVMQRAMEGLPVEEFPEPVYVDGDAPDEGHEPYTPPPTTQAAADHAAALARSRPTAASRRRRGADDRGRRRPSRRPPSRRAPTDTCAVRSAVRPSRPRQSPSPTGGGGTGDASGGAGRLRAVRGVPPARCASGTSGDARAPGGHVHPTRDDPVVAALSEAVGGPVGDRAGRHPWWTPVRVVLALAAICLALGHGAEDQLLPGLLAERRRALHPHVLLRPALPLHRSRVRGAELALQRRRRAAGPVPGDGVPGR